MLQAKYTAENTENHRLDGLEKALIATLEKERLLYMEQNMFLVRFIQNNKRLGRSLGCPSLPMNLSSEIIQTIKDKSCLFIYYPSNSYKVASKLIS
jgi:hypothetical protein